jgi:hypothetical protein
VPLACTERVMRPLPILSENDLHRPERADGVHCMHALAAVTPSEVFQTPGEPRNRALTSRKPPMVAMRVGSAVAQRIRGSAHSGDRVRTPWCLLDDACRRAALTHRKRGASRLGEDVARQRL